MKCLSSRACSMPISFLRAFFVRPARRCCEQSGCVPASTCRQPLALAARRVGGPVAAGEARHQAPRHQRLADAGRTEEQQGVRQPVGVEQRRRAAPRWRRARTAAAGHRRSRTVRMRRHHLARGRHRRLRRIDHAPSRPRRPRRGSGSRRGRVRGRPPPRRGSGRRRRRPLQAERAPAVEQHGQVRRQRRRAPRRRRA